MIDNIVLGLGVQRSDSVIYTYVSILFQILFPIRLLHDSEQSSPCYTVVREFGIDMYTLLYLKWITNKDLLWSTQGTLLNVMWQPGWEESLENGYIYMHG